MVMEGTREDDNCKSCRLKEASVEQETRETRERLSTLELNVGKQQNLWVSKFTASPRNVVEARGSLTAVEVQR